ncbi:hypothetical protein HK104_004254, partial [Borealophlyctis nickersoniae]
ELIEGKSVALLGRVWHPEHSRCKECARPIGVDNFAEIEGFLYCEDHYFEFKGEYKPRKTNPSRKRASYIETELNSIKQLSTVRRVRNLLNFEKSVRVNIVTVDDDTAPGANGKLGQRRFVTSWVPEEWRGMGVAEVGGEADGGAGGEAKDGGKQPDANATPPPVVAVIKVVERSTGLDVDKGRDDGGARPFSLMV